MTIESLYNGGAAAIIGNDGNPVAFLQGDEALDALEDVQAILDGSYPMDGFETAEVAVDYYLSDYKGMDV